MQSKPLLWTLMASAVLMMTGLGVATADKRRAAVVETCNVASGWLEPASAKSKSLAANKVLANAAEREFVLLGEQHDDADHHRWQLQTLAGLYAYRPDMVVNLILIGPVKL